MNKTVSTGFDIMFTKRVNVSLGIPDFWFVLFTSTVTSSLIIGMITVPPLVLFAKITPKNVEATMFAFTTSVVVGSFQFGGRFTGLALN